MNQRTSFAPPLAAALVVAGLLQLMAITWLGTHSRARVEYVARAGPIAYLFGGAVISLLAFFAWKQRARPKQALGLLAGGVLVTAIALRGKVNLIGVVYHAEFVLHHFIALLGAAACVALPFAWFQQHRRRGSRRGLAPFALAALGVAALLALHLCEALGLRHAAFATARAVGVATLIASWLAGLISFWGQLAPRLRVLALVLAGVVLTRLVLAGPSALLGTVVEGRLALPMAGLLIVASAAIFFLLRPDTPLGGKLLAGAFAAVLTWILGDRYNARFGYIEDDFGGLARSLLGFEVPYPDYIPLWARGTAMLALFIVITTVISATLSNRDRLIGLALALMLVTGLGLREPQLVLMHGAAFWILIEGLTGPRPVVARATDHVPPPAPLHAILEQLAARLGLGEKSLVNLEQPKGTVLALRGMIRPPDETSAKGQVPREIKLDLRARGSDERGWSVRVDLGVIGRTAPRLELRPDRRVEPGQYSPLLTTRHRVVGDTRHLETLDEALLEALGSFPDHSTRVWDAGARAELGRDLSALTADEAARLITQLARSC